MAELTEADRTILAATRFYCDCTDAYCSLRNELDTAVEQILAAREAALLERLSDERVVEAAAVKACQTRGCDGYDPTGPTSCIWCQEDVERALAAVRAELLRQGGGE